MKIGNMLADTHIPKLKYVSDLAKTNFQEWSSSFTQSHQVPQAQDYPLFRFFSILKFGTFLENAFWSFLTTQMNNDKQKETLSLKNILLKRLLPFVCSNMAISILTFPKSLAKLYFTVQENLENAYMRLRENTYTFCAKMADAANFWLVLLLHVAAYKYFEMKKHKFFKLKRTIGDKNHFFSIIFSSAYALLLRTN